MSDVCQAVEYVEGRGQRYKMTLIGTLRGLFCRHIQLNR